MHWLTDLFTNTGILLMDYLLVPVLLWTVVAGALILILQNSNSDRLSPDYHYYLRLALIFALPAGILGTILTEFLSGLFTNPAALSLIVIQNPVTVTETAGRAVSSGLGTDFWLGLIGILVLLISTGNLLRIAAYHIQLYNWSGTLNYKPVSEIASRYQLPEDHKIAKPHPLVAFTGKVTVPFTFGWIKPRIVLPEALTDQPEKLQLALEHETRHILQKDFLLHYISSIIKALFWFHPLLYILHSGIQQYSEILCDTELLAERQPASRKAYAQLIMEFATQTPKTPIAVNMASPKSSLKKRIAMITLTTQKRLNLRNSLFISIISAVILVLAVSCTDIGNNGITNSEVEEVQSSLKMEQNGEQPLYIINGEKWDSPKKKETLGRIKVQYIDKIEVSKGEKVLQEYGTAGQNGVIKITLVNKDRALKDLKDPDAVSTSFSKTEKDFYIVVENPPKLIGGLSSIQNEIVYPEEARNAGIEGKVIIQFIVNEQGNVESPKIIRSIGSGLDKEAVRVVKTAKFEPGYQDGKPVPVKFTLPIHFKLSNGNGNDNANG